MCSGSTLLVVTGDDLSQLSQIFQALGNEARLSVVQRLQNGESVSGLHHDLGMSRSGLQKNIERLIDANLVYRPDDSDQTYDLTYLGEILAEQIDYTEANLNDVMEEYREQVEKHRKQESETLERMEEAGVDTKELEQKIQARAWENVENQFSAASKSDNE